MNPFKTGDKVVALVENNGQLRVGKIYEVGAPNPSFPNHVMIVGVYENGNGKPKNGTGWESFRAAIAGQDYQLMQEPVLTPVPTGTKASNPKEALGSAKLALHLVPDAAVAHMATAFFEGASKYGAYNWRVAGVRASTYIAACRRHMSKWWNGEDRDPVSKVHHLANAAACLCIILDAEVSRMLNDDRPPKQDLDTLMTALAAVQGHLADLNAASNPPQYTEAEHGAKKA